MALLHTTAKRKDSTVSVQPKLRAAINTRSVRNLPRRNPPVADNTCGPYAGGRPIKKTGQIHLPRPNLLADSRPQSKWSEYTLAWSILSEDKPDNTYASIRKTMTDSPRKCQDATGIAVTEQVAIRSAAAREQKAVTRKLTVDDDAKSMSASDEDDNDEDDRSRMVNMF